MKIGTSISFLMLVLIVFGYIISDDVQTHQKLSEVNGKISELNSRLVQSEESLRVCTDQVAKDQLAIDERDSKISELAANVSDLKAQISQLKMATAVTEAKQSLSEVLGSNPIVIVCLVIFQILTLVLGNGNKQRLGMPGRMGQPTRSAIDLTDTEYRLISQRRQAGRK